MDTEPAATRLREITKKQQRFVDEDVLDRNATQAAIRAGYSPRGAQQTGSRLKRHERVGAAIRERLGDAPDAWRPDPTPLQQRLVHEFLRGLDVRQAAIRAGYKPDSASKLASQMRRHKEDGAGIRKLLRPGTAAHAPPAAHAAAAPPAGGWQPRAYQKPVWDYFKGGGKRAVCVWHRRAGKDEFCLHLAA
ncbi:MAG TPA: terminase small subunit, partial [Beijerinckiaceae bacterium]|nr:terminase small subunit [Beijerinckiaceae bacterium]